MRDVPRAARELVAGRNNSRQSRRAFYFFVCYFGVMHALPLSQMLTGRAPSVFLVIDSLGLYAGWLGALYLLGRLIHSTAGITMLDGLVTGYLVLAIGSVVLYLQKDNPATILAYQYGIHYVVFPSLTFFAVKRLSARDQVGVVKLLVGLNLMFIAVGLLMYYSEPQFYTDFIIQHVRRDASEQWQVYGRVQSYLGSTTVAIMAGLSLLLLDYYPLGTAARAALCAVFAVGGILSQQRGAYVGIGLGLLYQVVFRKGSASKKLLWVTALAVVLTAVLVMFDRRNAALGDRLDLISYTKNRLTEGALVSDILAERNAGYVQGWENVQRFPFGLGLGATLSAADDAGANPGGQVVDANYMRVLSDLGIPGLFLFCGILATGVWRASRSSPRFLWTSVVATYAIVGIGTNVFDSFYVSHVYWTLLGVIDAGVAVGRPKMAAATPMPFPKGNYRTEHEHL
jgi:hypothetical protein